MTNTKHDIKQEVKEELESMAESMENANSFTNTIRNEVGKFYKTLQQMLPPTKCDNLSLSLRIFIIYKLLIDECVYWGKKLEDETQKSFEKSMKEKVEKLKA